ncbi:MAG TPA: hypothetical protein VN786_01740 [Acidimicrobiales bacterium]|nr:hypothetical protein [Acidimicrobiales bacterium]
MAAETQTTTGRCPTHGAVEATRQIPRITFPPIITAVLRAIAKRRPYRCPTCAAAVETV